MQERIAIASARERHVMRPAQRWWVKALGAFACALTLVAGFNWVADPFQLFRRDTIFYVGQEQLRYVNVGLILHAPPFDAIVIGSSYFANVRPQLVDEVFGTRTLLSAVIGSAGVENPTTLRFALRTRPEIKTAFLETTAWGLCGTGTHPSYEFPMAIYEGRPLARFAHLLRAETTRLSYVKLSGKLRGQYSSPYFVADQSTIHRWFEQVRPDAFGTGEYLKSYTAPAAATALADEIVEQSAVGLARCFQRDYLVFAKAHPNVRFYFINSPLFQWGQWNLQQSDQIRALNRAQEIIAEAAAEFPNAHYFDFNAAVEIVNDCRRYMDMGHFDQWSADQLFRWMREGRYRRTPATNAALSTAITDNVRQRVACPPDAAALGQ